MSVEKNSKIPDLVVVTLALVLLALLHHVGIGCPIKFTTGISCPGCGMTRAWLNALQLRFDLAFAYHPLFWSVPFLFLLAALRPRLNARSVNTVFLIMIILFLAVWIFRLISPNDADVLSCGLVHEDVVSIGMPGWLALFTA